MGNRWNTRSRKNTRNSCFEGKRKTKEVEGGKGSKREEGTEVVDELSCQQQKKYRKKSKRSTRNRRSMKNR